MLAEGNTPAYLIDRTSGRKLQLAGAPQEGAARSHSRARRLALMMPDAGAFPPPPGRLLTGKTYSVILPNLAGAMKSGSKVAVVVGDLWADDLAMSQ